MIRSNSARVTDRRSVFPNSSMKKTTTTTGSSIVAAAPVAAALQPISPPKVINKWHFRPLHSDPLAFPQDQSSENKSCVPLMYQKMQYIVQEMLHSDTGVPIRSHRSKLLATVPSAFTGYDIVHWLMKRFTCSKVEAIHVANMLYNHGFYFSIDSKEPSVKEDGSFFRFQTPHLWPSQNFDDSDFEYAVYLVKQVKRSKTSLRLADYELANLRNLQKKLILQWDYVNERASDEVRIVKEQKKMARSLMDSQERAFWRLRRPPPGEKRIIDCLLSKFATVRKASIFQGMSFEQSLQQEIVVLRKMIETKRYKLSTSLEGLVNHCNRYIEFDPMLQAPVPSNPWISNDDSLWILERSLVEFPTERQLKFWACSLYDLLMDVTGRYKFEQFCKKQYCSENVRFWQSCQDLKMLPFLSVPGSVRLIYDEYIDPNANNMVNLSADAFEEAQKDVENPSRYSFSLAQEQVYTLMQNDIYPRFLKTDYDVMLKAAPPGGSIGKGFFKKFIPRTGQRSSTEKAVPIEIISPCHPQRYTRRQLSISHSSNSSFDNLFLNVPNFGVDSEEKGSGLIDALASPKRQMNLSLTSKDNDKQRRVSAPSMPRKEAELESPFKNGGELWMVNESEEDEKMNQREIEKNRQNIARAAIRTSLIQSHSLDDLSQFAEDDDNNADTLDIHKPQMALMSLRTPNDMFDDITLDRKKSISIEDLHGFVAPFSPLTNFSPGHTPRKISKAAVAAETMVTINVPSPDYNFYSSNDSVHSAISMT